MARKPYSPVAPYTELKRVEKELNQADTVDKIIEFNPDRIAMFSYAHVPWMKKQQGALSKHLPLGMDKYRIFRTGIERFTDAGYLYIGMDHFAHPGDELCLAQKNRTLHRNFQGYTTKAGADLYGMGVSSISDINRTYAQSQRGLQEYYAKIENLNRILDGLMFFLIPRTTDSSVYLTGQSQ